MKSETNKFKALLDSTNQRFNTVFNADNTLDQKAGTLMGFEIAFIIGYLTLFASQLEGAKIFEGILGIIFLSISSVLLVIINWPRTYAFSSLEVTTNQDDLNKGEKQVLLQMISDEELAISKNVKILKRKSLLYKIALVTLFIGSLLLILSKLNKFYV